MRRGPDGRVQFLERFVFIISLQINILQNLSQDYAATLATAVNNGLGTSLHEFNPEKVHLLAADLFCGQYYSTNFNKEVINPSIVRLGFCKELKVRLSSRGIRDLKSRMAYLYHLAPSAFAVIRRKALMVGKNLSAGLLMAWLEQSFMGLWPTRKL